MKALNYCIDCVKAKNNTFCPLIEHITEKSPRQEKLGLADFVQSFPRDLFFTKTFL